MDLTATYTVTYTGDSEPTVITPKVRHRTTPDGEHRITVQGIAPLLADRIDAITDEGDRLHVLQLLRTAKIVISDQTDDDGYDFDSGLTRSRDQGRLTTTYTDRGLLHYEAVLDLAEQLRAHFADQD
ncbi:hypothetical protein [Streptomyces sp. NPDC001205]